MKLCLLSTALIASIYTASAAGSTCQPNTAEIVNSRTCRIECGVDRPGADYKKERILQFDSCVERCGLDPRCLAVEYHFSSKFCYFKSKANKAKPNSMVDGAVCDPPQTTTPAATSTSRTTTTTTTTKAPTATPTFDPRCHEASIGCYEPGNVPCDGTELYCDFCICVGTPSNDLICAVKPDNICDYGRSCTGNSDCDQDEVCAMRVCNCNDDVNGVCFPAKDACTDRVNNWCSHDSLFKRNPRSKAVWKPRV